MCVPGLGRLGNTALVASRLLGEKFQVLGLLPLGHGLHASEGHFIEIVGMFSGPQHFERKFLYQLAVPHAFIIHSKNLLNIYNNTSTNANNTY